MTKYLPLPSAEKLWEFFDYKPLTGELIWKVAPYKHPKLLGQVAGSINTNGYHRIQLDGVFYQAHRLVWMWMYGTDPADLTIDHINHNPIDNRISNLRLATQQEQSRYKPNTVGARPRTSGRYQALIKIDGQQKCLGTYDTLAEASAVYHKKAREVFGEFYCEPDADIA